MEEPERVLTRVNKGISPRRFGWSESNDPIDQTENVETADHQTEKKYRQTNREYGQVPMADSNEIISKLDV